MTKRLLILLEVLLILSVPLGLWILAKPERAEPIRQTLRNYGLMPASQSR